MMAVGDTYRLAVRSTYTGVDDIVNVFHFRQTAAGGTEENKAMSCIQAFEYFALASYLACIPNSVGVSFYSCRGVDGSEEQAEMSTTQNGTAGVGDMLPLQAAPIISWRTGLAGRRRRGRSYLPPPLETWQHAGVLNSGAITALEAFAADVLNISDGVADLNTFELVIFSPEDLTADPQRVGTLVTPVVSSVVRDVIGTQRRRRQGTGS